VHDRWRGCSLRQRAEARERFTPLIGAPLRGADPRISASHVCLHCGRSSSFLFPMPQSCSSSALLRNGRSLAGPTPPNTRRRSSRVTPSCTSRGRGAHATVRHALAPPPLVQGRPRRRNNQARSLRASSYHIAAVEFDTYADDHCLGGGSSRITGMRYARRRVAARPESRFCIPEWRYPLLRFAEIAYYVQPVASGQPSYRESDHPDNSRAVASAGLRSNPTSPR
jgi:hypothetical protein